MSKKKVFMSVTTSAIIASVFMNAQSADAATHTVKAGDTLWSIAQKHSVSVGDLKSFNKLKNDSIYPGQVFKVREASGDSSKTSSSSTNPVTSSTTIEESSNSKGSTYTVKSGDSLSKIANAHGVSVKNLMDWNKLTSTLIFPGNKLSVQGTATTTTNNSNTNSSGTDTNKNNTNSSNTYVVKSGDSLSKIAANYGVTVNNLMDWNKLTSTTIYIGDKLTIMGSSSSNGTSNSNSPNDSNNNSNPVSGNQYTVKSGDTLGKIAATYGVTVKNLMDWNGLSSTLIFVGNKLSVNGTGSTNNKSPSNETPNNASNSNGGSGSLVDVAKSVLGSPYVWAGSTPGGFDCSGFIYWAFNQAGEKISRQSTDGYYNRSYIINNPEIGDLVFFENTYRSGISHMGIYLGSGQFIHAGTSSGVTIANVNSSYWGKHFHSYKRFY